VQATFLPSICTVVAAGRSSRTALLNSHAHSTKRIVESRAAQSLVIVAVRWTGYLIFFLMGGQTFFPTRFQPHWCWIGTW